MSTGSAVAADSLAGSVTTTDLLAGSGIDIYLPDYPDTYFTPMLTTAASGVTVADTAIAVTVADTAAAVTVADTAAGGVAVTDQG